MIQKNTIPFTPYSHFSIFKPINWFNEYILGINHNH